MENLKREIFGVDSNMERAAIGIYEMDDPKSAATKMIELMYEEAGEHNNTEKLLMSPDEAADILREFTKGFEEYGAWDIEDDVLVTALKVAIKCLEVTL